MNWDTLLKTLLIVLFTIIHDTGGLPDAVSTGSNEAPWLWMSAGDGLNESNTGDEVLEVVEVLEEPHVMATPIDLNTEPRFVGHLRRKLCKVGLGVGQIESNCDTSKSSSTLARLKRSPSPQFVRIDADENKSPRDPAQDRAREQDQKGGRSEGAAAGRFFGGAGLDGLGLNNLLKPHISPSVGVHFGAIPYGYGGGYGGYHGGYGSPFQFNLGPLSINPFGGLRFSLHNGRPHIRPTLDLLITPNKRKPFDLNPLNPFQFNQGHYHGHHNNFYQDYPNRFSRDTKHPHIQKNSRNPLTKLFKSSRPFFGKSLQPSQQIPVRSEFSQSQYAIHDGGEPALQHNQYVNNPNHQNENYSNNKQVVFNNDDSNINYLHQLNNQRQQLTHNRHPISDVEAPIFGISRSESNADAVRDDRDNVFRQDT